MTFDVHTAQGYRNLLRLGWFAWKGTIRPRVGCGHLVAAGRIVWVDDNGGLCASCAGHPASRAEPGVEA